VNKLKLKALVKAYTKSLIESTVSSNPFAYFEFTEEELDYIILEMQKAADRITTTQVGHGYDLSALYEWYCSGERKSTKK